MNKLHRLYVVLLALQILLPEITAFSRDQVSDNSGQLIGGETYAIQSGASGDTIRLRAYNPASRFLYNQKIRKADSAFNQGRDLLLAEKLYQEAVVLEPDKDYPKDQIIEIGKQLTQKRPLMSFRELPVKTYAIIGFIILVILASGAFVFIGKRKNTHSPEGGERGEKMPAPEGVYLSQEERTRKNLIISEVMQLYPKLSREISPHLKATNLDYGVVWLAIESCLNSPDEIVRMEAELAQILMDEDDPFSMLDKMRKDFTQFEQLHIIEMIGRNNIPLPDFSRWLNSPNKTIADFSRRMMGTRRIDDLPVVTVVDLQKAAAGILKTRNEGLSEPEGQ